MSRILVLQQPSSTSPVDDWLRAADPSAEVAVLTGKSTKRDFSTSTSTVIMLEEYFGPGATARILRHAARFRPDFVVSNAEHDVARAGAVRSLLSLPGLSAGLAARFRDKVSMKKLFADAGIPAVPWISVGSVDDIFAALERFGDIVVKPRSEAAARGVVRFAERDQVLAHALADDTFLDQVAARRLLAEQYVHGTAFHVDAAVRGREIVVFSPSRFLHPPHTFAEHDLASLMLDPDSGAYAELREHTERLVRALPDGHGVSLLHFEFHGAEDGRMLAGEVAARLGGGMIKASVQAAFDVDLSKSGYLLSAGLPLAGDLPAAGPSRAGWVLWTRSAPPPPESLPDWASRYWTAGRAGAGPADSADARGGVLVTGSDETQLVERLRLVSDRTPA